MDTPELANAPAAAGHRRLPVADLRRISAWYLAGYIFMLLVAVLGHYVHPVDEALHRLLGMPLTAPTHGKDSAPTAGYLLEIVTDNLRSTIWPVVIVFVDANRSRWFRPIADVVIYALAFTGLVVPAASLGLFTTTAVPFFPHLPVELLAETTSLAFWTHYRRRQHVPYRVTGTYTAAITLLVIAAAIIEVWAVPHY